jgi:hypothetical protein
LVLVGLAAAAVYVFLRHPDLMKSPPKCTSLAHVVAAAAPSVRPGRHRPSRRARKRTDRTGTPNATTEAKARSRMHRPKRTTKPSDGGRLKPSEAAKPEPTASGADANAADGGGELKPSEAAKSEPIASGQCGQEGQHRKQSQAQIWDSCPQRGTAE